MLLTSALIIVVALGFGLLILIHELGHFLVAKALKIRVEAFSFGFGPHIGKRWGETEYRLSLIPLGGYVKLAGEMPDPSQPKGEAHVPKPYELVGRPPWQRAAVFAAGSVMNGLLGMAGFIVAFAIGMPSMPAIVGDTVPGGPAWRAGLQANDRIVAVNSLHRSLDFSDLRAATMLTSPGKPLSLVVERDGKRLSFDLVPEPDKNLEAPSIGIAPKMTLRVDALVAYDKHGEPSLIKDEEDVRDASAPARQAGLRTGDELIEFDGKTLESPRRFVEMIADSGGKPAHVKFRRAGSALETDITPAASGEWLLGVEYGSTTVETLRSGSWAEKAGLRKGDTIARVNDKEVATSSEAASAIAAAEGEMTLLVTNGGTRVITARRDGTQAVEDDIAFEPGDVVNKLYPGFPADSAGMMVGDRILSIGGKSPSEHSADRERMNEEEAAPLLVRWERAGSVMSATMTPQRMWVAGVAFAPLQQTARLGLLEACAVGSRKAFRWIPRIYISFKGLITGSIPAKNVQGPISIAVYIYAAANHGAGTLAYFLAFISINLALLNLLPIPILDGGHILFTLVEKIKGSPVSERVQVIAAHVGLVLLIALMLFALFNDVRGLLGMDL